MSLSTQQVCEQFVGDCRTRSNASDRQSACDLDCSSTSRCGSLLSLCHAQAPADFQRQCTDAFSSNLDWCAAEGAQSSVPPPGQSTIRTSIIPATSDPPTPSSTDIPVTSESIIDVTTTVIITRTATTRSSSATSILSDIEGTYTQQDPLSGPTAFGGTFRSTATSLDGSSPTSTTIDQATAGRSNKGLSNGAKIAIGVTIPIAVIAALVFGLLFLRRRREAASGSAQSDLPVMHAGETTYVDSGGNHEDMAELPANGNGAAVAGGGAPAFMQYQPVRPVNRVSTSNVGRGFMADDPRDSYQNERM